MGIFTGESSALAVPIASLPGKVSGIKATPISESAMKYEWNPLVSPVEVGSTDTAALMGYELC